MASADFTTKPTQLLLEGLTSVGFLMRGGGGGVIYILVFCGGWKDEMEGVVYMRLIWLFLFEGEGRCYSFLSFVRYLSYPSSGT